MHEQSNIPLSDLGECWIAEGTVLPNGYVYLGRRGGQTTYAHRQALAQRVGRALTRAEYACHTCDNRACNRADGEEGVWIVAGIVYRRWGHLFLGDATANMRDAATKGRTAQGARHSSYLYPERRPRGDRNGARLHPERIRRGDQHPSRLHPELLPHGDAHWTRRYPERIARGTARRSPVKLTETQVVALRQRYADGGVSMAQLARTYDVCTMTVCHIIHRKTWTHV